MSALNISVYWPARVEGIDQCATRLAKHFEVLATESTNFQKWFRKGRTAASSHTPVDTTNRSSLTNLIEAGANRTDIGKKPIPELGYRIAVWNGVSESPATSSVSCGISSGAKGISNSASVSVEFDTSVPIAISSLIKILEGFVTVWNPETGRIFRLIDTASLSSNECESEFIDLAVYFHREKISQHILPLGVPRNFGEGQIWNNAAVEKYFL